MLIRQKIQTQKNTLLNSVTPIHFNEEMIINKCACGQPSVVKSTNNIYRCAKCEIKRIEEDDKTIIR